jgi:hypothetical protein
VVEHANDWAARHGHPIPPDPWAAFLNDFRPPSAHFQFFVKYSHELSRLESNLSELEQEVAFKEEWVDKYEAVIKNLEWTPEPSDNDEEDNDDDDIAVPDNSQGVSAQSNIERNLARPQNRPTSHEASEHEENEEKDPEHPDAER